MAIGSEKCRVRVLNPQRVIAGRVWLVGDDYGFAYRNSLGKHHVVKIERRNVLSLSRGRVQCFVVRELSLWDGPGF